MKKITLISLIAIAVLGLTSCKCSKNSSNMDKSTSQITSVIQGTVARNYFFNNNVSTPDGAEEFVITSQSDFDKYFSPAAFMGTDGEPTKIDFKKQSALCVVLDETNIEKRLDFIEITSQSDGSITCNYCLMMGRKQSFTTRPCLIVLDDKKQAAKGANFHRVFVR